MIASQAPRERLLAAAVEKAMNGGITDLSLRELAAAIGTSHRMLLYHFGSREGLLNAVSRAVEQAQRNAVSQQAITTDARQLWDHFSDPKLWPAERLFFELYAHALLGRPGTEGFLDNATEPWVDLMAAAIEREAGLDSASARAEARLGVAVTRGLLLDLLASGDRDAATQAFERYLQHTGHADTR
jgi:AcrR family transcriptional regulator